MDQQAHALTAWRLWGLRAQDVRIEVWQLVALDRGLDRDLVGETPELAMSNMEDWNLRTDAYVPPKAQYVEALDECCEAIRTGELPGEIRGCDFRRTLVKMGLYRRWSRAESFDRGLRWMFGNRWNAKLDILIAATEILDGYVASDVRGSV